MKVQCPHCKKDFEIESIPAAIESKYEKRKSRAYGCLALFLVVGLFVMMIL